MIHKAQPHTRFWGPARMGLLACLFLFLLNSAGLKAQVIDENTPQDSTWIGVGADSADFVAQSFVANVRRVRKIGIWLKGLSGTAEVRLSIAADNGLNSPDLNAILHESTLITPDTAGGWVWDSTFSAVFTVSQKYWILVDGYNNLVGTGYAAVGTSNSFTSTSDPLRYSTDGGNNWPSVPSTPLAIYVEGDNCTFPLSITPSQPLMCAGGSVSFGVPSGFVSYIWSTGQTSSAITASMIGVYTVTAVDTGNCTSTASVFVVQEQSPYTGLDDVYLICPSTPLQVSVPPFYSQYAWSNGSTGTAATFSQAGSYWVRITSSGGCVTLDSFVVQTLPPPTLDLGRDSSLCQGDTIVLDAGPGFVTYVWSTGQLGSIDTLTATTAAWLQVIDSAGCSTVSDTVNYTFNPLPAVPTITVIPTGLQSSFANGFAWSLNGQAIPGQNGQELLNPEPGVYTVEITNAFGCKISSDTFLVLSAGPGDFVSGGFSPNADGVNDRFFVEGIERYPDCKLQVFNRWSEEVYYQEHYDNTWDGGGRSGVPLPVGDYYYILDFGNGRESQHGTVMISR